MLKLIVKNNGGTKDIKERMARMSCCWNPTVDGCHCPEYGFNGSFDAWILKLETNQD